MTAGVASPAVPILLYHSVSHQAAPKYQPWNVTPGMLAEHLDALVESGHTPVPLASLLNALDGAASLPDRPAVVTFDDGLEDFLTGALPVLADRNIPATLFVTTAYVGGTSEWLGPLGEGRRRMLSWDQLRDITSAGVTVGAHGHTHRPLDELGRLDMVDEVVSSRRQLEERLQLPVDTIAYPHGYHDEAVKAAVRDAGFIAAVAVRNALSSLKDDVMALARITINSPCSPDELLSLIDERDSRVAPFSEQLRTKVWRVVRQTRRRLATSTHP